VIQVRPLISDNFLPLLLGATLERSPARELSELSADALRINCTLLDSPLPLELAGRYIEPCP
jgi:hypothetical protein